MFKAKPAKVGTAALSVTLALIVVSGCVPGIHLYRREDGVIGI